MTTLTRGSRISVDYPRRRDVADRESVLATAGRCNRFDVAYPECCLRPERIAQLLCQSRLGTFVEVFSRHDADVHGEELVLFDLHLQQTRQGGQCLLNERDTCD